MKKITWVFLAAAGLAFLSAPARAQEISSAPATIETRWDPLWGMKYFRNDIELSQPRLKDLLLSGGDPQIALLQARSESDETLGTLGLCASVTASLVCLVLPATNVSLGTLKITLPCLPLQLPALAIGAVAAFFKNASGAAQYTAVQRYNAKALRPDPLTWDLSPASNGLVLDLKYAL